MDSKNDNTDCKTVKIVTKELGGKPDQLPKEVKNKKKMKKNQKKVPKQQETSDLSRTEGSESTSDEDSLLIVDISAATTGSSSNPGKNIPLDKQNEKLQSSNMSAEMKELSELMERSTQTLDIADSSSYTEQLSELLIELNEPLPGNKGNDSSPTQEELTVKVKGGNLIDNLIDFETTSTISRESSIVATAGDPMLLDDTSKDKIVDGLGRTFTVLRTGVASMIRIPVQCNNRLMVAVLDTAAEVTIMSDKMYQALTLKPPVLRTTVMYAAGRGMKMDTMVVGPVEMKLGSQAFFVEVYVAPIDDDMLLGLDFLAEHQATVDLKRNILTINEEEVNLYYGSTYETPVVAKVTVADRTVIPANSVAYVPGKLDADLEDYIVESSQDSNSPLLVSRGLYQDGDPTLCIVNATNWPYTIRKNAVVAQAAKALLEVETQPAHINKVKIAENHHELHDNVRKLSENTKPNLTAEQVHQLESLLVEYQNIFSKDEFDIGVMHGVEHSIDTGSAKPVKQRMRKTPHGFEQEEKVQLEKNEESRFDRGLFV